MGSSCTASNDDYDSAGGNLGGGDSATADCQCTGCPSIVRATVVDQGDCSYSVSYTATKKGTYNFFSSLVTAGGIHATFYTADTPANFNNAPQTYAGNNFHSVRAEETIDFSYAPNDGLTGDTNVEFQTRWEGFVRPSRAAEYTFYVDIGDDQDAVELSIDNTKIIDQWSAATGKGTGSGPYELSGTFGFGIVNHLYDLRLHYHRSVGASAAQTSLKWQSTGTAIANDDVAKGVVRSSRLFYRSDVRDNCKLWSAAESRCQGNYLQFTPPGATQLTYGKQDTTSGSNKGGTVSETLLVHSATTCSATSVATGPTLSLTTSGTANTFTITARDAYNNQRTVNTDMTFTVDLHGSGGLPVYQGSVSTMSGNVGTYEGFYTVTAAKNYELFVKYGNDNVKSSPFTLVNRPVTTSGTKSTVTGTGLTAAAVNAKSAFTVQARDQYANARTKGEASGDEFVVRVVRSSAGSLPELGATGNGANRAMETIHATMGTATDDGKHAGYYNIPSTGTGNTWFHASYAAVAGLEATYYDSSVMNTETAVLAAHLKHSWVDETVTSGALPTDGSFTAPLRIRWRAFFKPASTAAYTFKAALTKATAQNLRMWVDNQLIIDKWGAAVDAGTDAFTVTSSVTNSLTASKLYDFCVDLKSNDASATSVTITKDEGTGYSNIAASELLQVEDLSGSPFQVTVSS